MAKARDPAAPPSRLVERQRVTPGAALELAARLVRWGVARSAEKISDAPAGIAERLQWRANGETDGYTRACVEVRAELDGLLADGSLTDGDRLNGVSAYLDREIARRRERL